MGARENLQRLFDRKAQEIKELEDQIERARVYLQAIQDSIKALTREPASVNRNGDDAATELRPGTNLAKAKEAIQSNGGPMHVVEILAAIGIPNTKEARTSLIGSLGGYVRKGQVFSRPRPNTFSLIGMSAPEKSENKAELPESFGKLSDNS
jgi:hypothetical protein